MMSLKNYLSHPAQFIAAYRRVLSLLLQGIALHAVDGNQVDRQHLQEEINRSMASLSDDIPSSELLVIVGRALHAMEDYNQRTSKFVRLWNSELQHVVSMLTHTVVSLGAAGEPSAGRLLEIGKSIASSNAIEDMQKLKLQLGECLEAVRKDACQRAQGQSSLDKVPNRLEASERRIVAGLSPEIDSATGLPAKVEADDAIRAAVDAPRRMFLLIAVCNRLQAINARFGYAVGDQVLAAFAEHFKSKLSPRDQLFRWRGPTLVALLDRNEGIERVRQEIRQFADIKLEKTTELGQRTIFISISAAWTVLPATAPLDVLVKQLETFTAAQIPRDYA